MFVTGPGTHSPRVSLLLSVRTRGPWLEVIEGRTRVKCCCSPRRTPASPQLSAIVHLHPPTHTHIIKDSEARDMAKNCRDLSLTVEWIVLPQSPPTVETLPSLTSSCDCISRVHICSVFSLVLPNNRIISLLVRSIWQNFAENTHRHAHAHTHTCAHSSHSQFIH